ncbi:DrmB family protein [Undibacterium arcticum]
MHETVFFSKIIRVARLREVRVVRGFTRINPPFDPDGADVAPPFLSLRCTGFPQSRSGEKVFLQFNLRRLAEWETRAEIIERCAVADASWTVEWHSRNEDKPKPYPASPRLLLMHTFAHALIRQLTLECGYSSASLRERLYVSEGEQGMAGLLIYTATPDSDGTLGGLQRQAMPDLLGPAVEGAIRSAQWCSSDPLCINGEMTAPESHSLASCHSCTMVPETSCEMHNRFLDRALLVGKDDNPTLGYFRALLETE